MEENTKEISLSQLWTVAKKAFKMGIVYVLISVIVVGAILSVVRSFGRTSSNVSTISLGGEVNDSALITLNSNKTSAINDALTDFKGGSRTDLSSDILANLSIVGLVPNNLPDTTNTVIVPSSFKLTLSNADKMGLTQDESNEVLSLISKSLLNLWSRKSIERVNFNIDINSEIKLKEYYQVIDSLSIRVERLVPTINANVNVINSKLKEEDKNIKKVIADLDLIKERIKRLKKVVETYAVEKFEKNENGQIVENGDLSLAYDREKERIDAEKSSWEAKIFEINARIGDYKAKVQQMTTATGAISYSYDDSGYMELTRISLDYNDKLEETKIQLNEINLSKDALTANASLSEEVKFNRSESVKKEIKDVVSSIEQIVVDYKSAMDMVEDVAYSYSGSLIKVPAKTVYSDAISVKLIAVVLIVVALGAYLVAYVQTYSKLKKKNFFEESNKDVDQK